MKLAMLTAVSAMAFIGVVDAATITSDGSGDAISIQNLVVDGTTYDVTFGMPGDTTFLGDGAGATDAVNAIVDLFNADLPDTGNGVYDQSTGLIDPLFFITYSANSAQAVNRSPGWSFIGYGPLGDPAPVGYADVDFAQVQAGTPEPGSLATMLGGVALLGLASRKHRTQLMRRAMRAE